MAERPPNFPASAFLWPAYLASSAGEVSAAIAQQWLALAVGPKPDAPPEPGWTTPNTVALALRTVRLRDFATAQAGTPTLVCAPFALHGATIVDLAPGHSLVAALRATGLRRLFVTDWRPAAPDMGGLGIDDYLADLNVLVDELGGRADLVGLCQGGWMALLYAARFPGKVRRLVLAGAPVDIAAGDSQISALARATPLAAFRELIDHGGGCVEGHALLRLWSPEALPAEEVHQLLQAQEPLESAAFARLQAVFHAWYRWTLDLPGAYYLETVERLFKNNELATGRFVALGRRIDLAAVRAPLFLIAARDDEVTAPAQLFAAERLVGSRELRKATAPGRHLSLFLGRRALGEAWQEAARWLAAPDANPPRRRPRARASD